jgi:signal transduction histidine kinase
MIEDNAANFEDMKEVLYLSGKNALNLIEVVRNIRAIDDKKLKLGSVNLREAVGDSLAIMTNRISSKNIYVEMNIDSSLSVKVEKVSFVNSVINNILSNAIKFSYPGSKITISGTKCKEKLSSKCSNREIELSFRDQGIGIPEDDLKRIFILSKAKSRIGTDGEIGVGYGMPLINRFINLYQGNIEIKSKVKTINSKDHGTTITLVLNPG